MPEKKFWDKESRDHVTIDLGSTGEIRVKRVVMGTRESIDIRRWYPNRDTGELLPGKGVLVPLEDSIPEEVAQAIATVSDDAYKPV